MNPQVFGKEHLIYVIVCLCVGIATCVLAKKFVKTEKAKSIFMRCLGAVLFAVILANRFALVFERETANWYKLITDSFCSTSSYVLGLTLMIGKKDNNVLHFVWFISLVGGAITTFYPNFIDQHPSFMYPPTILGMLHHTIQMFIVILMLLLGYVRISIKKFHCSIIGLVSYLAFGGFLLCVLGAHFGNPFYMTAPALGGTPLTVWVIAPIYLVVQFLILFTVELVRKKKNKVQDQANVSA